MIVGPDGLPIILLDEDEAAEAFETRSECEPVTEGPEELDIPDSEVVSELQLPWRSQSSSASWRISRICRRQTEQRY